ncbi:MAG: hypothetical protein ACRDOI_40080, partial [Trebonia sp.]
AEPALLPQAATEVTAATAAAALPRVIQRRLRPWSMTSSPGLTGLNDLQSDEIYVDGWYGR